MENRVRWLAFGAIGVAVLGLVLLIAPQNMPGAKAAKDRRAEEIAASKVIDCTPNPHFEKFRGLSSDWQHLRSQSDGSKVEFNPFTIVCNPTTGERDVWVQVLLTRPQQEKFEDEKTIETISFTRERYLYRIDCVGRTFAILERRIMGEAPEDNARVMPMAGATPEMRPIQPGGVVEALAGPACSRGR
jgi:hypothetical protein